MIKTSAIISPAGSANERNQPNAGRRVLLVEDHADTAVVLSRILKAAGYYVRTANSVASALEAAAAEPFDIVVSDIGLPDATGYDLMLQLKKAYALKGVALSGYGMEDDVQRGRDAGFVEHIVKPVKLNQLEAILQRLLTTD
jgi:CheY-like chemotaxis protein